MIPVTTLPNGVRLAVAPMRAAPLAAIYLRIEAGSRDEQDHEHGAAHFLEHMVFKGTPTRGVGAVAAEIEAMGGDLNAYTSHDHTVLHATVPSDRAAAALDVLVDMATRSVLDPTETASEREVVLEEISAYDDDPMSVVADAGAVALFGDHPLGRPVLGTVDSVRNLDHDTLRAFWARQWGPQHTLLVIAGDVDVPAITETASVLLGAWRPATGGPSRLPAPPAKPGWHHVTGSFDTTVVDLSWRVPGRNHPDEAALEVACAALGQSSAALLPVRLQLERRIVADVWSAQTSQLHTGTFNIGLIPHPDRASDAVAEVYDTLTRAVAVPPGDVVRRARESLLSDALYASETVDGVATELSHWIATEGTAEASRAWRARVAAVSPSDVSRVIGQWLRPEHAIVTATVAPPTTARPRAAVPPPGPQTLTLDSGLTLLLLPDGGPVASVRAAALGGALATPNGLAGLPAAWSGLVGSGAGHLNAEAFARRVDDLTGAVSAVAGRSSVGLSATFPSDRFRDGLDLFGAALTAPRFEDQEWARIRDELREDLRTAKDRAGEALARRTWRALWRGHPWRHPGAGTEASLNKISAAAVARWHQRLLTPDNLVIAVTGGFDPEQVHDTLAPWLDALPSGPARLAPRPAPLPILRRVETARAGNEQAWLQLVARGPGTRAPDRAAMDVAMGVLGGQGGRLFLTLRERRGLAYSVWASSTPGWDGGVVAFGLATQPHQHAAALDAMRDELYAICETPPTPQEMTTAKAALLGGMAMGQQTAASRATAAALSKRYGLPWDLPSLRAELEAVTARDVQAAIQGVFNELVTVQVFPRTSAPS